MDELLGQSVATLQKARGTMTAQLKRHSMAPAPDRLRLPRLQSEARQFAGAAAALLARIRLARADKDIEKHAQELVEFFDGASRLATFLLQRAQSNSPDATSEPEEEAIDEAKGDRVMVSKASRASRHLRSSLVARSQRIALLAQASPDEVTSTKRRLSRQVS